MSISAGVARKWKEEEERKGVFTKSCGVGLRGGVVYWNVFAADSS